MTRLRFRLASLLMRLAAWLYPRQTTAAHTVGADVTVFHGTTETWTL